MQRVGEFESRNRSTDTLFDGCVNILPLVRIKLLEGPTKEPANKPANHEASDLDLVKGLPVLKGLSRMGW
jgi:hypothetical protein